MEAKLLVRDCWRTPGFSPRADWALNRGPVVEWGAATNGEAAIINFFLVVLLTLFLASTFLILFHSAIIRLDRNPSTYDHR